MAARNNNKNKNKNRKGCAPCGHCRVWRVNKAFVRATEANGSELKQFRTCNRCSRVYRKPPLSPEEFRAKYRGGDHADSEPEEDDEADEDEDDEPEAPPKQDEKDDQGDGSDQGGMGQAIPVA